MFTDRVVLEFCAGKGGNGIVAWRREKYLPKGGPYGGDGGKGGSIILEVNDQLPSLEAYRNRFTLRAENGQQGGTNNRRGRNGRDLIIQIPRGTLVKDGESGEIIRDFTEDKERLVICKGGRGGRGNSHFKTSTNRAPNTATPGRKGEIHKVELELKLIADIGLVGFPNAGKSTFISKVTDVPVKVAPYPFTTLRPNLGYIRGDDAERVLIADIPGIIEGAHKNRGLGIEFLRHIERTSLLLFVLDASGFEERDPIVDFSILRQEIAAYNPEHAKKPFVIALNKIDLAQSSHQHSSRFGQTVFEDVQSSRMVGEKSGLGFIGQKFREAYPDVPVFEMSALTGQGVGEIVGFLKRKLSV